MIWGFHTWVILNNLTCERNSCKIKKYGKGKNSMNNFIGYVSNYKSKSVRQNVCFRCGMTHVKYSSKNSETNFKLQKDYLKRK